MNVVPMSPVASNPLVDRLNRLGWILAAFAFVALGALWAWNRARPHVEPRWDRAAFEVLYEQPGAGAPRETWVVALHPTCPHCRQSVAAVIAKLAGSTDRPRLAVLVVDTPRPPDPALAPSLGVDQVWWDRRQLWREAWHHGVYGEVLRFDAAGRLTGVEPPADLGPRPFEPR